MRYGIEKPHMFLMPNSKIPKWLVGNPDANSQVGN